MVQKTPEGEYDMAFSFSAGSGITYPGLSVSGDGYYSNADSYDQLAGIGSVIEGNVGRGRASWGAGGSGNSSNSLVGVLQLGYGINSPLMFGGGSSYTWMFLDR